MTARRYGDTLQWRQYAERSAARTPEEWQAVHDAVADLDGELASALDADVAPGSPEGSALVDCHRAVFTAYFPLKREMLAGMVPSPPATGSRVVAAPRCVGMS